VGLGVGAEQTRTEAGAGVEERGGEGRPGEERGGEAGRRARLGRGRPPTGGGTGKEAAATRKRLRGGESGGVGDAGPVYRSLLQEISIYRMDASGKFIPELFYGM
ncbi:unnamed protein product, partial [Urochloa humidicola]